MLGVKANWSPTNRGHPQEAKLPGISMVVVVGGPNNRVTENRGTGPSFIYSTILDKNI